MSKPNDFEDCKRIRLTVKGQNCYMIVGKNFIDVTVPYENRPESFELRQIISEICDAASTLLEKINNKEEVGKHSTKGEPNDD